MEIEQEKKSLEKKITQLDKQLDLTIKSISTNEVNHMTQKTEEKLYQQIKKDLDSEMVSLEDRKTQIIGQIDELDSRKDWIDWVGRFGKDINKKFQKVSSELLEGLIDKIVVHPIMGKDRDEKEIQVGHELQVFFDLPILEILIQ